VTKIAILNRNDCCEDRLKGTKVFVGDNLFGTINDPKKGDWSKLLGRETGTFLKIQGNPNQYLHFCGIKVWGMNPIEKCIEKPIPTPEPEIEEPEGGLWDDDDLDHEDPSSLNCDVPKRLALKEDQASMSSVWKDGRTEVHPHDVFKSKKWNANFGWDKLGELTCIHTLTDKDGAWWQVKFQD